MILKRVRKTIWQTNCPCMYLHFMCISEFAAVLNRILKGWPMVPRQKKSKWDPDPAYFKAVQAVKRAVVTNLTMKTRQRPWRPKWAGGHSSILTRKPSLFKSHGVAQVYILTSYVREKDRTLFANENEWKKTELVPNPLHRASKNDPIYLFG
jgi:hypothetical protein